MIDGALPDYAFDQSIKRFKQLQCELIVTTGGPVPIGSYHQRFSNYSEVGKEKLIRFGFDPMKIIAIPGPHVLRDRTYNNAVSVRKWLDSISIQTDVINVLCVGPHARRTRLLYKRAFENQYKIGIISLSELGYDKDEWWKSSIGFRTVIGEIIAYLYVKCCFHPVYEAQKQLLK